MSCKKSPIATNGFRLLEAFKAFNKLPVEETANEVCKYLWQKIPEDPQNSTKEYASKFINNSEKYKRMYRR